MTTVQLVVLKWLLKYSERVSPFCRRKVGICGSELARFLSLGIPVSTHVDKSDMQMVRTYCGITNADHLRDDRPAAVPMVAGHWRSTNP
jgi:hypothetical protein